MLISNVLQGNDAQVETIKEDDVVLQKTPVEKERETVMDLETEVLMMDMRGAREILSVVATTANSLVVSIMKKMIAARNLQTPPQLGHLLSFSLAVT